MKAKYEMRSKIQNQNYYNVVDEKNCVIYDKNL